MIGPSQRPLPDNTQQSQQTNFYAPGVIRTRNPSMLAAVDLRFRPRGQWDRRKATISFVMSVRLSVCPRGTPRLLLNGFPLNLILTIFRKFVQKISFSSKYDKKKGYFAWRPTYLMIIPHSLLLRVRNISGKICRENQDKRLNFSSCF